MKLMRLLLVVLLFLVCTLVPIPAQAAGLDDFTVTNFEADYYLSKQSPHGHMKVVERIDVNFPAEDNHGILRAIPNEYKNHPHHVHIESVKSAKGEYWQYQTYSQSKNLIVKIGDPNRIITGNQSYIITYTLDNVMTFFSGHDELFWDVNGDQWLQPFTQVVGRVHVASDIALQLQDQKRCYAGRPGDTTQNCQISKSTVGDEVVITASAARLTARQTLSIVMAFNSGTFQPYSWRDTVNEHLKDIGFAVLAIGLSVFGLRQWWRYGKDYRASGIVIPEYQPPQGIDVLSAGILQDYAFDNRDMTAAIINLAIRGYVKIIETDSKTWGIFKKTTTKLELVNAQNGGLTQDEQAIIKALFPGTQLEINSPWGRIMRA